MDQRLYDLAVPLILHSQTPSKKNPHILVKQTNYCYILGSPKPLIGNQVRHLLIIFSILLPSSPLFGKGEETGVLFNVG